MTLNTEQNSQIVYQAHPNTLQHLQNVKDQIRQACAVHANRPVYVKTLDGQSFEGVIVNTDDKYLYISISHGPANNRYLGGPGGYYYNNSILPLVLYELLVISLVS
ncbi:hypothetical protein J2Z69_000295 [Paenibacillus shirakamiensis]|uniref:Acetyl-CoA acetyltransferase n=1 Tax=Paenibacillus shirakamiensis TaxID=1265935 RepID=A0ABS4JDU4_9BACL|nr:acetyl-CoA acetyltransferase [Paenibacillus shirakamiensis]MBP1999276.1 hypothetical protein [Paenibacillus shirakamiensis]